MKNFDFEQYKQLIWAYGFMILSIIIMILGILQQLAAIAWVAGIYLALFIGYMFRMELKIRSDKLAMYEMLAGIRCLESRTVIDENIVEESLFYIKDVISIADIDIKQFQTEIESKFGKKTDKSVINSILEWKIIKFKLLQPDSLSKYEVQEFDEMYIVAPEGLSDFHETPNTSIFFNGKSFIGTKITGDLLFITWALPDKPLFLLYNSPKLVLPLTNVRKELEGAKEKIFQTLTQEVLDYKEKQKNFDYIIEEKIRQIDLLSKQKSLANARAEFVQTEALEKPDPEIDPTIIHVNRGLLWFLGIGFVIFAILYLSTVFGRLGL